MATCITVDASGNVYVSGTSSEVSGAWFRMNYATLKYDSNGNMLWVSRYTPYEVKTADPTDLAVDDSGNVYVTGTVGNYPYTCYTTIKYNPQGKQLWRNTYNSPDYLNDRSSVIAVDGSHNVYVTGSTGTIKYDADGKQLWVGLWVGSDMRMDDLGNIYLAGGISGDFATIKYYPNGDTGWVRKYNGPGDVNDGANAMAMDCFRNIYVTGYSGNWPNDDYATIKYDSNGNQLWVQRYNGPANYWDQPSDITVDFSGNIYVTGKSAQNSVSPYNFDYLTIKYVQFLRGDVNYDRQVVVADIVYLVSYLFKHGPAPNPLMSGDANCDGKVTISDIVYLVAYLFKHGPQPCS
ncbi:MAG TPA: SBBP repeat-containing protein [Terriglobales bacterium]|nr:SBBP repeat-containing protein [Terriglobales bacterium]